MGFAMSWVDDLFRWYLAIMLLGSIFSIVCGLNGWLWRWYAAIIAYPVGVILWLGFIDKEIGVYLLFAIAVFCFTYWVGKEVRGPSN